MLPAEMFGNLGDDTLVQEFKQSSDALNYVLNMNKIRILVQKHAH